MRAIIVAVGSEMLNLDRQDTNSLYVARKLREKGILTDLKIVAPDHLENLAWVVKLACQHAQLVVLIGGLGPTEDDVTREAVASGLKRKLVFRDEIKSRIEELFRQRGLAMPEINTRQAFVVEGAEVIENTAGTAPGQWLDEGHCKVLMLPGPPAEMKAMFDAVLAERVAPLSNFFVCTRQFKLAGITESETDALVAGTYTRYENPQTTILASPGMIEIHLLGRSRSSAGEARRLTDELAAKIRALVAPYLFAEDDTTLEEHVVKELISHKLTLAVAESCTGGILGGLITSVPGSSDAFLGGVIAYDNKIKTKLLGVRTGVLRRYGAVSQQVAGEMAEGCSRLAGADIGVAVTGIAGPSGATPDKPVGLVYIAVAFGGGTRCTRHRFGGERQTVRLRAARAALNLLRLTLLEMHGKKERKA